MEKNDPSESYIIYSHILLLILVCVTSHVFCFVYVYHKLYVTSCLFIFSLSPIYIHYVKFCKWHIII